MLENISKSAKLRWRQFYKSYFEPLLSAEEMKKLSWAMRLESFEAVPEIYRSLLAPLLITTRAFPYMLLTPTYEGLLQSRTTEKLVFDLDDTVHVFERLGDRVKVYAFPIERISRVGVKIVLLVSQITIWGLTQNGQHETVTIKFNTATEELFLPILGKMRRAVVDSPAGDISTEMWKFDYLEKAYYPFMNYARRSILGGEKVQQVILQPMIQRRALKLLGKTFYKTLTPAHLSILTDRELILIHEEQHQWMVSEYGKLWDYIPLKRIVSVSVGETEDEYLRLSIQLPGGVCSENLFQASARQEIDQLLSRFANIAVD